MPPPPPGFEGRQTTFPSDLSSYLSGHATKQVVEAAGSSGESVEDFFKEVRQEETQTMVKPGLLGDVDLANAICTSPEGNEVAIPSFEEDETMKDEGDNDVSFEPPPVPHVVEVSDAPVTAVAESNERGNSLDDVAWPPRALDSYPVNRVRLAVLPLEGVL